MDRVEVAGLACEVHGEDRLRPLRDELSEQGGIEVEVVRAHVAEDGRGAGVLDDVRGRGPRDRRRDHLVARADVERDESEVHRGGARVERQHVLDLEVLGQALLEQRGARPGREPARAEGLRDGGDLLVADRGRLEAERRATPGSHRPGSVRRPPPGEPARAPPAGCARGEHGAGAIRPAPQRPEDVPRPPVDAHPLDARQRLGPRRRPRRPRAVLRGRRGRQRPPPLVRTSRGKHVLVPGTSPCPQRPPHRPAQRRSRARSGRRR